MNRGDSALSREIAGAVLQRWWWCGDDGWRPTRCPHHSNASPVPPLAASGELTFCLTIFVLFSVVPFLGQLNLWPVMKIFITTIIVPAAYSSLLMATMMMMTRGLWQLRNCKLSLQFVFDDNSSVLTNCELHLWRQSIELSRT